MAQEVSRVTDRAQDEPAVLLRDTQKEGYCTPLPKPRVYSKIYANNGFNSYFCENIKKQKIVFKIKKQKRVKTLKAHLLGKKQNLKVKQYLTKCQKNKVC